MRSGSRSSDGFTLIEITIVLAVIALLVTILIPSIGSYVDQARHIKVRRDLEVIGLTVFRLKIDNGQSCLRRDAALACTKANRVDLLESDGPDVVPSDVVSLSFSNNEISGGSINWQNDGSIAASMMDQFVLNTPLYLTPRENIPNYPRAFNIPGWRGAYMTAPIGPDPWGKKYLVNSVFLSVATDAISGTAEGQKSGEWSYDVFVISAGPNGLYETPFGQKGAVAGGDDIIYVITGDTR